MKEIVVTTTNAIFDFEPRYDAIVIGAGGGGGVAAGVLAEAGKHVLVLERGAAVPHDRTPLDHLRNHRLELYGCNTQPTLGGDPRVNIDAAGRRSVVEHWQGAYGHNANVVGGGTLVYGAQAWRFHPIDFRMASTYGVPEGSSLSDWPIDYDTLEPYYDKVEWEIGVSGGAHAKGPPRRRGYPMPPIADNPGRRILSQAATKLGWDFGPSALLINTAPYNGRPACMACGMCIGFGCPNDAKTGSQNTMLRRALATGRCTLVTGAVVERLVTDERGQVIGLSVRSVDQPGAAARVVRGRAVVLAAAAVESARLLLNSPTDREPHGIGNNGDQVGRNLQGHHYIGMLGLFDDEVTDGRGPGVSIASMQFMHGNPGVVGGGLLANEFLKLPIMHQKGALPPGSPKWGLAAKRAMRHTYRRTLHVQGPSQDIPSPDGRMAIDRDVRDRWGLPVARFSGTEHPATLDVLRMLRTRAGEWLTTAGARQIWGGLPSLSLSAGQHQAGTCRMGNDPGTSVVDATCRVHSQDRLFLADGGPHVTNGGVNPVLTIMALAWRTAEQVAQVI